MKSTESISLTPCLPNLMQIESLITRHQADFSVSKKAAMLIAATEIFANIVEHAEIPEGREVGITVSYRSKTFIRFEYETANFDELLEKEKTQKTYFDKKTKRYRGLGLKMINNLAKNIEYTKASPVCSIEVFF